MPRRLSTGCTRHCLIFLSVFETQPMHPRLPGTSCAFSSRAFYLQMCCWAKKLSPTWCLLLCCKAWRCFDPAATKPESSSRSCNAWFLWCEDTADVWLDIILLLIEMYASITSKVRVGIMSFDTSHLRSKTFRLLCSCSWYR